jgi:hypothetical protein
VNELALRWVEEDSTHTPRQLARWQKYKERYNILERRTLTANEFIAEFDELPDEIHITLIGTSDQLHSRPVMRRMTALPRSIFELRISPISPIVIPPIVDPWNELPRDPGSPHNRILEHTDTDDTNESDDDTVLSPSVDADNLTAISQVSLHYYYQELNI